MFYDLHVHPEESEIQEMINIAKKLEFKGLAFTPYFKDKKSLKGFYEKFEQCDSKGLDLVKGVEIKAENVKSLKKEIYKVRTLATVVVVRGEDYKINRVSCEDSRVDILAHPEYKRSDSGLDHTLAENASKNNVSIEINLHELLETYRKIRSHVLSHLKRNIKLAKKYQTPLIITSGARNKYELRSPRELSAILQLLGFELEKSKEIVEKRGEEIVRRNRKKLSGEIKFEGVEIEES